MLRAKRQMLLGGILLVVGWLVLFLIVLEVIPSSIWLNMLMYSATVVGFILGMVGAMTQVRINIHKHRQERQYDEYDEYDEYGQ